MKHLIAAISLSVGMIACGNAGLDTSAPVPGEGATLRDVVVPEGFAFESTRPVDIAINASSEALPDGQGAVEVRRPGGEVVYRGPVFADRDLSVAFAMPTAEAELEVELRSAAGVRKTTVAVSDGAAIQF